MRTGYLTFVLSLIVSFSSLAAPFDKTDTPTAAVPEQSFKLAGIYWLPDYLKDNMDSNHRTETDQGGGDRHDLTCSTYGACGSIPAHMSCEKSFTAAGTTCYKSCSCLKGYVQSGSADVCQGCYNPCDTVTAVSAPYGCQTYFSVCPSKCQVAYPDNCRNRNAVSTPYGCKTYFSDCSTKCQTAYPDNCHNRTAVPTPYGCQTYFSDCSSKCQTAYPDNCRNYSSKPLASSCANGCAQGKTISDCTTRCATGCKASCDTGYHLSSDQLSCQTDSCPSGYEAGKTCGAGYTLEKSGQSGTQVCGKCVVKACAAGSTSCSGANVAVANGYYSGDSQCYTCKTCEQAGQKTCNGSCIATSQCCGGCPSGQKCENGTCTASETCRMQAEAKGYKVIETAEDLDLYADTSGNKLVVNGTVAHSSSVNFNKVTVDDAKTAVGGLCTQDGALQLNKAYITGNFTMNVPVEAKNFYLNVNLRGNILFNGSETSIDTLELTSGMAGIVFKGGSSYVNQVEVRGSSARVSLVGKDDDVFFSNVALPMNQRYPVQFDSIQLSDGATLNLHSGMGIGAINITGVNSRAATVLNISSSSRITIHPMKPYNDYSPFAIWDCQNAGCIINFGEQGSGGSNKFNFNNYGLDFLPDSSTNYNGKSSPYVYINNFELNNVGAINSSSLGRPVYLTFSSTGSSLSLIYFAHAPSTWLGAQRSSSGISTCNVTAVSLSMYSGCSYDNTCSGSCWEQRY